MDKQYITLFKDLAQATEISAEKVYDLNIKNKADEKSIQTAQTMRDDYAKLREKLTAGEELTRADYAKLLVGAVIVVRQLETRIKDFQKAIEGYKLQVIPRLDRINNETKTDEEAKTLANELFQVIDEAK